MRELKPSIHRNKQTDNISHAEISANRDNLPCDLTCSATDILSACIYDVLTSSATDTLSACIYDVPSSLGTLEASASYDLRVL